MSVMRAMWQTKRATPEPRMEIMPLIDVIFLMLTFFIYALVLMVPIELLPVPLQVFGSAQPATPAPLVTVTIALDGKLFVNREPVALEAIPDRLREAVDKDPRTKLAIAMADGEGEVDRGPIFTELWDHLVGLGLDISLVGQKPELAAPEASTPPGS